MPNAARPVWQTLLAAAVVSVLLAGPAGEAVADTVLTSCTESAFDSAVAAGGLVTFDCGGPATITLTSAIHTPLPVTIDGGNAITLTGKLVTQLFFVSDGQQLALRNLVLDKGYASDSSGGAIANYGTLSLDHVRIQNSKADRHGGAILAVGPLSMNNSSLMSNSAASGGGIYAQAALTLTDTTVMFNHALDSGQGLGGGIVLTAAAALHFSAGAVSFNTADRWGGGLYLAPGTQAAFAPSSQTGTWLGSNVGDDAGGAIFNDGGQLALAGAELEFNQTLTTTQVDGYGGAIDSQGALSLSDSALHFNLGRIGGGLIVNGGSADITRSGFFSNTATGSGGGLYAFANATVVTITDSLFDGNQAALGGGLARSNAHLTIARSAFTHNRANEGEGLFVQGVPNPGSAGYVEIRDSTISSNAATGKVLHDGGIALSGLLDLRNVTLKDNLTGLYILNSLGGTTVRLQSSVLDNLPLNCDGTGTSVASSGHNLATDSTCALSGPDGDQSNVPAGLGPLTSDPGRLTFFHIPLLGSLLINNGGPGCSATDQRGALRPNACDIGAVEFGGLLARLWLPLMRR